MAGHSSRDFTISWDSTTVSDLQSKSFSINAEPVDTTTDDDAGWRTLLDDAGVRSVEAQMGGIADDESVLGDIMAASDHTKAVSITLPTTLATPGTLAGNFFISNFEYNGSAPDGAVEFSFSIQSTGAVTFTASSA